MASRPIPRQAEIGADMTDAERDRPEGEPAQLDVALREAFGQASSGPGSSVFERLDPGGRVFSRILLREEDSDPGRVVKPKPPGVPSLRIDRYQVLGEVARGGVGVVLKGHDVDLGRDVAVKMLREEHQDNAQVLQRFVEEAQIGGQLQHPGIVPVYDLGLGEDNRPYFTMKLVKGQTLAALLAERVSASAERRRFLQVFQAVCQTLGYAHARGVIHRDLKPANVMVGAFGEVLVVDWGMGKVLERGGVADERKAKRAPDPEQTLIQTVRSEGTGSHSEVGSVMGTPRYMPPEQATGNVEQMDERSDVFSLGAILCELLTGKPPYAGDEGEVLRQAMRGQVAEAHARLDGSGADAELIDLAKVCLAPAPLARPRNAGAVAKEVGTYLASLDEKALHAQLAAAAATAKATEERKRRRLAVALAASVVGLVLLGAGGWSLRQSELRKRSDEIARRVDTAIGEVTWLRTEAAQAAPNEAIGIFREALAVARQAHDIAQSSDGDQGTRERSATLLADLEQEERRAQARARQHAKDEAMLRRIESIRGELADDFDRKRAAADYAAAFRFYLDAELTALDVEEAARRIRESAIGTDLVLALEDWCDRGSSPSDLAALIRRADPDPWRARLRESARDREALVRLAEEPGLEDRPAQSLGFLARRLLAVGEDERARRIALAGWRRAPGDFWACAACGHLHGKTEPPDHDGAVRFMTAALAARPRSAAAHSILGNALKANGQLDEAILAYRAAIRLDPEYVGAHFNLGLALQDRRQLDEAILAYREAIRLDPECAPAHYSLGNALQANGQLDEAIAAYRERIRLDPEYAPAHYNLGNSLRGKRQLDEAILAYREAIRLDPENAWAHNNLGIALQANGQLDEAIAAYRAVIRLDPKDAPAHSNLGDALQANGQLDEAATAWREAIRLDPEMATAHYNLGIYLQNKDRLDEAILAYREAIRLDPENAWAHNNLGTALRANGQLDEAIAAYRGAIRLDPEYARAHHRLAGALHANGQLDEAIAACREAIRVDPGFATAHCNLGHALLSQGRIEEAVQSFRRGHELGSRRPGWPHPSAAWVANAERMLEMAARLPAIRTGAEEPPNATDALALAEVARVKRLYGLSARLRAEAFELQPKLAADMAASHRYGAACAAALAGAGKSEGDEALSDAERARWRSQARAWLRADLDRWEEREPSEAALVVKTLTHWKLDPDLAGIRDEGEVAKLPPEEQEACRALWREVGILLQRAKEAD